MLRKFGAAVLAALVCLIVVVPASQAADAPYVLTPTGIQLNRALVDNDHVNVTAGGATHNIHLESKCLTKPSPAECTPAKEAQAQHIGTSFVPWSVFGLSLTESLCVTWVQVAGENFHYGADQNEGPYCGGGTDTPNPEKPSDKVTYGNWSDETYVCGSSTVTRSRTVITISYVRDQQSASWIEGDASTATEYSSRAATDDELASCDQQKPPDSPSEPRQATLDVQVLSPMCQAGAPWIQFQINLDDPDHQATDDEVTITLYDTDLGTGGKPLHSYTLPQKVTLGSKGAILWPGASVQDDGDGGSEVTSWPGWSFDTEADAWVPVGENYFGWTRNGVKLLIEGDSASVEAELAYPPATWECANPPIEAENTLAAPPAEPITAEATFAG